MTTHDDRPTDKLASPSDPLFSPSTRRPTSTDVNEWSVNGQPSVSNKSSLSDQMNGQPAYRTAVQAVRPSTSIAYVPWIWSVGHKVTDGPMAPAGRPSVRRATCPPGSLSERIGRLYARPGQLQQQLRLQLLQLRVLITMTTGCLLLLMTLRKDSNFAQLERHLIGTFPLNCVPRAGSL
jgi:hypothetical protein